LIAVSHALLIGGSIVGAPAILPLDDGEGVVTALFRTRSVGVVYVVDFVVVRASVFAGAVIQGLASDTGCDEGESEQAPSEGPRRVGLHGGR